MSRLIRESSSPNRNSASVLDSSVLPTPEGPAKMNEPPGRFGSFNPARVRRIACESAWMACSWPITRLWSSSSIFSSRCDSSSVSLNTGCRWRWPGPRRSARRRPAPRRPCRRPSLLLALDPVDHGFFSSSRRDAAFSKSWASIADSFSRRTPAMRSSSSRRSGGAVIRRIRNRNPPRRSGRSPCPAGTGR